MDITARQQAEEKLTRTLEDLERSNKELEEFAYVASHDLQEPLRKIANFSEMLAKQYQGQLDQQAVRYFGYVTDGAKRLQTLINDLLSYSRLGRAELPLIPASLEEILIGTLNDLHAPIKENHVKISHEPLPTLKVNPHQMRQLLQNLIANAIKFHSDQPPMIHIAARQEGREWLVSIWDNGIGFEPQYAETIFTVFKRLHNQEQYPGTGIGLAICKKIVERHGGRIWAESGPDGGATFYFTIPT
jgi:light-regulated signal transduction histidine kinase (bacteriophytochrome)